MTEKSTIILAVLAVTLVIAVIVKELSSKPEEPVGQKKPRATLRMKNKNSQREEPKGCDDIAIDSPDFSRCATLGSGRTVLPGNPVKSAHNINTSFVKDNFEPMGNPFAMKIDDSFVKEDFLGGAKIDSKISRSGGQALPFSQKGTVTEGVIPEKKLETPTGGLVLGKMMDHSSGTKFVPVPKKVVEKVPAPPRSTARSSVSLGNASEGVKFDTAFLGTAVSPTSSSLGASQEEIILSAQQIKDINVVQRTNGGQLNLLVHS